MKTHLISAAALVAASIAVSAAQAHYDPDHAALACEQINEYPPVIIYDVELGEYSDGFVIWLQDANGDVWRCIADDNGNVQENEPLLWA